MNTQKKHSPYLLYTILFPIVAAMVFSFFVHSGKTMLWQRDGAYQHYNAFLYLGSWIRTIFKTLISEHRLVIPMFEWGLSYGSDIITTLSYYTFGDPFALISVFTPAKYGEIGFVFSILLRFYAAGLAFIAYARRMNCAAWSTVCAAFMYIFCTYSLTTGVRHPYFMSPMIYLPLVLLGCEKIFKKESPLPFAVSVFLSAFSNFYFFYMIAIFTIIYVVLRLVCEKQYRSIKVLGFYLLRFGGFAILGCMMAALLLLPNIMNFLGNSRINQFYTFDLFYTQNAYRALWGSAVSTNAATSYTLIGMAPLAYLGLGGILTEKKGSLWAKLFFLIELLFLLFPAAGYMMNGFGYVSNRWVFAWSFLIASLFAKGFPLLLQRATRQKMIIAVGYGVYILGCALLPESRTKVNLTGCALLFIGIVFVLCASHIRDINTARFRISRQQICQIFTLCLTVLCVFDLAYFKFPSREGNYISDFRNHGDGNKLLANDRAAAWKLIDDTDFYRIDNSVDTDTQANHLISSHQSTTGIYWSIVNPKLVDFIQSNSAYHRMTYYLQGLHSRSYLLTLASAKYFVAGSDRAQQAAVPYGYSYVGEKKGYGDTYSLYRSENSLPFGYTYKGTLSRDAYDELPLIQRQQAMLQNAVLETDTPALLSLPESSPVYNDKTISYTMECDENVTYDGTTFSVSKNNASVTLSFSSPGAGELYVEVLGLDYKPTDDEDSFFGLEEDKEAAKTTLIAKCGNASVRYTHYTDKNIYTVGRKDYLMNLGYSEEDRTSVTLKFSQKGFYTMKSLSVLLQPMELLEEQAGLLREDILEDVKMDTNHITGTISLDEAKLLCFSLPYSKGWRVFVDGEEAELLCTNLMYSGVVLDSGSHTISLVYRTPYLLAGALISLLGFLIFLVLYRCRKNAL